MATAVKHTKVTEVVQKVVLELTHDEARFIQSLVGKVSGDFNGPRVHASPIYDALRDVQITALPMSVTELHGNIVVEAAS
jgi:hypothetical protein